MTPNAFELRHEARISVIVGSLIIFGIIAVWFFFITGFSYIANAIDFFAIIVGVIIVFFSLTGIIIALLRFNEANNDYISYKRLMLQEKQ